MNDRFVHIRVGNCDKALFSCGKAKLGKLFGFIIGRPTDELHPLPKAAKPVWANQLTGLPSVVVYAKFQFVYTSKSKSGSQRLLASTSSNVLLERILRRHSVTV